MSPLPGAQRSAAAIQPEAAAGSDSLQEAVARACSAIAPTWPLDRQIAVNPWWGMRDLPATEVGARLAALSDARCLMPASWYAERWRNPIQPRHLREAAVELGVSAGVEALREHLAHPPEPHHWHNVSALIDGITRGQGNQVRWSDEVVHQISQFCAASFQSGGALQAGTTPEAGLYRLWLEHTRDDRGIAVLMAEPTLSQQFAALPEDPAALLAEAATALAIDAAGLADYAQSLLLDVNGWASWIAYLGWQDALNGRDSRLMPELLAVRLGWELVLWRHLAASNATAFRQVRRLWQRQLAGRDGLLQAHRDAQRLTWVWQRAAERAYQETLEQQLRIPPQAAPAAHAVRLQAVFCIDVRSEILRRALESCHDGIQTLGFAGFFGLPIEFHPAGGERTRPQLPGLLKPSLLVRETGIDGAAERRRLNLRARLAGLTDAAPATFTAVEATGLLYAFRMLRDTLFPADAPPSPDGPLHGRGWTLERQGHALSLDERAELAVSVLRGMGLTDDFAPTVLLVGHGSSSRNNPHAAGLDCGACGGHSGEINARVLATLLNDAAVRDAIAAAGIHIPTTTRFVAALHDTTTDEVRCFDVGDAGIGAIDADLETWLTDASRAARRERASRLGLAPLGDAALQRACRRRGRDWSQVRPEWGLAGNASLIVAPRARTRHIDLAGRTFLHDYCWHSDADGSLLELIMTAPMLVTHWINMQYHASVTDNVRYGSGNKVLHNVVGGNLGVFEGNGGDLRIGLPLQSLHDGQRWMHDPLRLSVYIAAPREAIAEVAARHDVVRQLVDNEWLFLFRLDDDGTTIERLHRGAWRAVSPEPSA